MLKKKPEDESSGFFWLLFGWLGVANQLLELHFNIKNNFNTNAIRLKKINRCTFRILQDCQASS